MIKIAIYGKGGIGKSTTVSNLSSAFATMGYKVLQIGCDPKSDSTRALLKGQKIPTILQQIRDTEDEITLSDLIFEGENGVLCAEAGGPAPGRGCAGKGIVTAFEKLKELKAFETYKPDIVFYDVLGDVVCGGFAMPLRSGYADLVFIVTSGEMMSLYAAENISRAVKDLSQYSDLTLGGLLLNRRNIKNEDEILEKFSEEENIDIFGKINRSDLIQKAENLGKTVVSAFPESEQAENYINIAKKISENWILSEEN